MGTCTRVRLALGRWREAEKCDRPSVVLVHARLVGGQALVRAVDDHHRRHVPAYRHLELHLTNIIKNDTVLYIILTRSYCLVIDPAAVGSISRNKVKK